MFVRASNKNQVFLKADVEAFRGAKSEESVKTGQNESVERGGIKALLGGDMVTMDAELGYEMIEAFKDETTQKEGVYSFGAEADALWLAWKDMTNKALGIQNADVNNDGEINFEESFALKRIVDLDANNKVKLYSFNQYFTISELNEIKKLLNDSLDSESKAAISERELYLYHLKMDANKDGTIDGSEFFRDTGISIADMKNDRLEAKDKTKPKDPLVNKDAQSLLEEAIKEKEKIEKQIKELNSRIKSLSIDSPAGVAMLRVLLTQKIKLEEMLKAANEKILKLLEG